MPIQPAKLLLALLPGVFAAAPAYAQNVETQRPADFVNVQKTSPHIQTEMRYFTPHNFVGRKINGYHAPVCLLTKPAAQALQSVVERLLPMGLTLKVYDCYRPQTAVNDFAAWAKDLNDTKMRTEFYPTVDKTRLFDEGYIAYRSGHSRGSTVDLTIVPLGSQIPAYDPKHKPATCTAPTPQRVPDNSLDFGTGFDCFSPVSHPDDQSVSAQQRANRLLLQSMMEQAGFKRLDTEWWHFTLVNEPYPSTYFDFPVQD